MIKINLLFLNMKTILQLLTNTIKTESMFPHISKYKPEVNLNSSQNNQSPIQISKKIDRVQTKIQNVK